jgi:hypothetical protein
MKSQAAVKLGPLVEERNRKIQSPLAWVISMHSLSLTLRPIDDRTIRFPGFGRLQSQFRCHAYLVQYYFLPIGYLTAALDTHAFFDLASDLESIASLCKEVARGTRMNQTRARMHKVDSFLRESQRMNRISIREYIPPLILKY